MQNTTPIPVPANLAHWKWRNITPQDLPAVVALGQACYAVDGGIGFLFTPEEIRGRFFPEGPSAALGAFGSDGRLAACAGISIISGADATRARMVGMVRPELRGRGMGTVLMLWGQEQAHGLLAAVDAPRKVLQIATESLTPPAHRLYLAHGFACVFEELVMKLDLRQPIAPVPLPGDVTVVDWQPELALQFFQAYQAAFRERPGFPGYSAEEWIARVTESDNRLDWTLLARVAGEPVGFVIGMIDLTTDPPGGHIAQVGVVPAQRRRGLATALLAESARRMQAAGSLTAQLEVHVNNPGALKAYAQMGFQEVGRRARYERAVAP